jgi:hypothetical protein
MLNKVLAFFAAVQVVVIFVSLATGDFMIAGVATGAFVALYAAIATY